MAMISYHPRRCPSSLNSFPEGRTPENCLALVHPRSLRGIPVQSLVRDLAAGIRIHRAGQLVAELCTLEAAWGCRRRRNSVGVMPVCLRKKWLK